MIFHGISLFIRRKQFQEAKMMMNQNESYKKNKMNYLFNKVVLTKKFS
jgi:hypothetical protein